MYNSRRKLRVFSPIVLFHDCGPRSNESIECTQLHAKDDDYYEIITPHKKRIQAMLVENVQKWHDISLSIREHEKIEQHRLYSRQSILEQTFPTSSLTDSLYPPQDQSESPLTSKPTKRRRGNLPKATTALLKSWLAQHKKHPYPTEEEKHHLAKETKLNLQQISNWFINARRRHLPHLLENDFSNGQPMSSRNNDIEMFSFDASDASDNSSENGRLPLQRPLGTKCSRIHKNGAIKKPNNVRRRKQSL